MYINFFNFSEIVTKNTSLIILPKKFKLTDVKTVKQMYFAIKDMIVRGAPAIGIAGVHGVSLSAIANYKKSKSYENFLSELKKDGEYLKSSRPTAVNLNWGVNQQISLAEKLISDLKNENFSKDKLKAITEKLVENGVKLENEDIKINKKMGNFGAEIVPKGATILTHCNAGALATVGYGTALGVIRSAYAKDPTIKVFADETRPRGQGARLTTWELTYDGIDTTLITDGMCSYFMKKGMIDLVVVGADRIAANGDTANKIGTYTVAVAAKYHNVPFYIAAPLSTVDMTIETGEQIPIEERSKDEVTHVNGDWVCAKDVKVINPAFDVTPHELITGIITEVGIIKPDFRENLKKAFEEK